MRVEWSSSSARLLDGDRVLTNQLPYNMERGIVQLIYDEGVEVVIEGPAKFAITDCNQLNMFSGKVFVDVTSMAGNFVVNTPNATIIDYGTKFGINVQSKTNSEVAVYEGKVKLADRLQPNLSELLIAGKAAALINNQIFPTDFKEDAFVKKIPSFYQQRILKTQPVYFLQFELQKPYIYNPINSKIPYCSGIASEDIVLGPPLDMQYEVGGAYFHGQPIKIDLQKEELNSFEQGFTLSLWVKLQTSESNFQSSTYHILDGSGRFGQLLLRDGKFVHFFRPIQEILRTEGLDVIKPDSWYQLTVTMDYYTKEKKFYINGVLQGGQNSSGKNIPSTGCSKIILGNKTPAALVESEAFHGLMSEILLYDRALTDQEILSIFNLYWSYNGRGEYTSFCW